MLSVLVLAALAAPAQGTAVNSSEAAAKPHVLILAKLAVQKAFVKDAARFAVEHNMTPVTLDEFNAMLEVERVKDLMGCADVTCLAEISGAYGIRFVLQVRANPKGTRAMLTLHDTQLKGRALANQIVSHETAVDALLADFDQFRAERDRMRLLLTEVPCAYPWRQLAPVLGAPHEVESLHSLSHLYRYYDLEIMVDVGEVRYINTGKNGISTNAILSCL